MYIFIVHYTGLAMFVIILCFLIIIIYRQVLEVVAGVRSVEPASLAKQVYQNTVQLFKF